MPAYQAKWWQVATHAYLMKLGYTATFAAINLNTWNRMSDDTKTFVVEQMKVFEDTAWKNNIAEDGMGIICNTGDVVLPRSEEHTSELQSLMRISYAVFCLKKKTDPKLTNHHQRNPLNTTQIRQHNVTHTITDT